MRRKRRRVKSGEWRVESEEWRVKSGEWRGCGYAAVKREERKEKRSGDNILLTLHSSLSKIYCYPQSI
ncbi:MAG: hypothetical protein ACI4RP_00280 [Acutalibacteraceae bacterium]